MQSLVSCPWFSHYFLRTRKRWMGNQTESRAAGIMLKLLGKAQHIFTALKAYQITHEPSVQAQLKHFYFINSAIAHDSSPSKPCQGSSESFLFACSFAELFAVEE